MVGGGVARLHGPRFFAKCRWKRDPRRPPIDRQFQDTDQMQLAACHGHGARPALAWSGGPPGVGGGSTTGISLGMEGPGNSGGGSAGRGGDSGGSGIGSGSGCEGGAIGISGGGDAGLSPSPRNGIPLGTCKTIRPSFSVFWRSSAPSPPYSASIRCWPHRRGRTARRCKLGQHRLGRKVPRRRHGTIGAGNRGRTAAFPFETKSGAA